MKRLLPLALLALLAACSSMAPSPPGRRPGPACPATPACPVCPVCPAPPAPPPPRVSVLKPVAFDKLPGWRDDTLAGALDALRASCRALHAKPAWHAACAGADALQAPDAQSLRSFLEAQFVPYRVANPDGETHGLMTGYYEPLLHGSRTRHGRYRYPIYAPPDDLLTIDLASVDPELKHMRLRGRLEGRRVVPYYSRAEIESGIAPVAGKEIAWVDNAIDAFFLQVQGSGRIQLDDGSLIRVGYANQNGLPYRSIGRYLIKHGDLTPGEATMDGIKAWARAHPSRVKALLDANPSYVFFRVLPARAHTGGAANGPLGTLGVALTPRRSIAVDPRYIPLGAPVYIATTWPDSDVPLERLVFAQDTGGAIRGAVRADFFWGFGAKAGSLAGRMRQQGMMWVLLPLGYPLADKAGAR